MMMVKPMFFGHFEDHNLIEFNAYNIHVMLYKLHKWEINSMHSSSDQWWIKIMKISITSSITKTETKIAWTWRHEYKKPEIHKFTNAGIAYKIKKY